MSVRMRGFSQYTRLSEALKVILSKVQPLDPESIPLEKGLGSVLAEDIVSEVDIPPFDRSAVDGYAVRAEDTFGASAQKPVELRVVGSVEIGVPPKIGLKKGEAAKIMTGAVMPRGSDAAVMVENTKLDGTRLKVFAPVTPGKNVSARGEDVRAGEIALAKGQLLRPPEIGLLAAMGKLRIKVVRRPVVGVLATGSELVEPGKKPPPAKLVNANTHSLSACVQSCGAVPKSLGIAPDDPEVIKTILRRSTVYDMVIVSGGSSVGEKDLVPDAIAETGELLFHGVAARPGSPSGFGIVRGKPVFALSGFPAAALVGFELLVRPALLAMQCLPPDYGRCRIHAKLARKVSSTLGRLEVVRVSLRRDKGAILAEPIAITGSSAFSSLTRADGYVMVPENVERLEAGQEVEVVLYS
ncbi:MAG: gephyrin-like molybdotransferase Glp [Candidatus Hadarchaeum sp.]|uniref:molybdopterin molybdotransferase MoeA n=1 Tax=Candidatus Hadarchaeum sp. TaxID=2883567 RepID=UPI003D1512DE